MEDLNDTSVPSSGKKKRRTICLNVNLCLLCQSQTQETLVENSNVLKTCKGSIKVQSDCSGENYMHVSQYLKDKSVKRLTEEQCKMASFLL